MLTAKTAGIDEAVPAKSYVCIFLPSFFAYPAQLKFETHKNASILVKVALENYLKSRWLIFHGLPYIYYLLDCSHFDLHAQQLGSICYFSTYIRSWRVKKVHKNCKSLPK